MAEEPKLYGDRWRVVRTIGRGGQGTVYLVQDVQGVMTDQPTINSVREAFSEFDRAGSNLNSKNTAAEKILALIKSFARIDHHPYAALKELLPIDEVVSKATALPRMKAEVAALKAIKHESLITVLDEHLEEGWFTTEYFSHGTLAMRLDRYKGRALDALHAFRPIVEAVSRLHESQYIHRDIKPENVFIADDGHLVLGDCGLAIKLEHQERLTTTFENVGTRDYMPAWAYAMRLKFENIKPDFDVFSLGKLLWAMVSGLPRMPLWYIERPDFDLRQMFPSDPGIDFVHRILRKCVVEHQSEVALKDATALLGEVDETIRALESGALVPSKTRPMRCRFCGFGLYQPVPNFDAVGNLNIGGISRLFYACDNCGHLESFIFSEKGKARPWTE